MDKEVSSARSSNPFSFDPRNPAESVNLSTADKKMIDPNSFVSLSQDQEIEFYEFLR